MIVYCCKSFFAMLLLEVVFTMTKMVFFLSAEIPLSSVSLSGMIPVLWRYPKLPRSLLYLNLSEAQANEMTHVLSKPVYYPNYFLACHIVWWSSETECSPVKTQYDGIHVNGLFINVSSLCCTEPVSWISANYKNVLFYSNVKWSRFSDNETWNK